MTSTSGLGKVEDLNKKVAFSNGDTFVSQYGSHFSNPDIRRLQTTRPPTQSTRTTKSSAAEALNVVMNERTPRAESNRKGALDEQSIPMDINHEQQKEEAKAAAPATTKAWDYIKAMTHPNTPLLLLSPLPSIEDSALFLGDQPIQNDGHVPRVSLSDESSDPAKGKKRQREAVKIEEVYKGSKKLKPTEQPQDKAARDKVDKVAHHLDKVKGRGKGVHADEANKPSISKESKDTHFQRKEEANPSHSASSSSRSPSSSPRSTDDNESRIGAVSSKQDSKPVYSNGDQCKYNTKEQDRDVEVGKRGEPEKERHSKKDVLKNKDARSSDSKSSSKRRDKPESTEKGSSVPTTRRETDGPPVSSGKLREEATKLKHLADNVFKSSKAEGLNYYLFAGLKFLECCQQLEREAESKPEALKSAFVMYRDTAKFFENCGAMCLSNKEYARASLCYKCMAVALARAFILQKEKLKRLRDELWSQLNKSTSPPVSVSSTASRASSMSPSPTYKSIPSPSSGNVGPSQPPGVLQKELFFLSEVDDIFKALDAWNKAGVHCTGKLADLEVPFTLDSFFLPGAPPIFSVIDYVHKAAELL